MPEPAVKHKLLIQPVAKNVCRWNIFSRPPVQNKCFLYGVKIKNINNVPFPGGTISKILIHSGENQKLLQTCNNVNFAVSLLNPDKEQEIIFEKLTTHLNGIVFIEFVIEASGGVDVIETFQFDKANKKPVPLIAGQGINNWMDVFFVISEFEHQQLWTNRLLIILTAITLVQGLWGIKEFVGFCWNLLINLFFGISHSISFIIKFFSNIKHP
ncbi:MAG: hypothetical protein WBE75_00345 [Candidatus Omnitrophota bacterium]